VGGVADHVHFLASLNTTHCVADLVREVKKASSGWASERYSRFGWQTGYGAFTLSAKERPAVINYILNQEEHHRTISSTDELLALLKEHDIQYDPRYFV
jgi:putative transposase